MGYVPRSDLTVRAPQQGPGQRSKALGSAQLALPLPFEGLLKESTGKLAGLALQVSAPANGVKFSSDGFLGVAGSDKS